MGGVERLHQVWESIVRGVGNWIWFHQLETAVCGGLLIGVGLIMAFEAAAGKKEIWVQIFFSGAVVVGLPIFVWDWLVVETFPDSVLPWGMEKVIPALLAALFSSSAMVAWLRFAKPAIQKRFHRLTRGSELARNVRTDVRKIDDILPDVEKDFDPEKFIK